MMSTTTTAESQGREPRAKHEEITFRSATKPRRTREKPAGKRRDEPNANERKSPMNATTSCERTATDETLLDFDAMDISAELERYLACAEDEQKCLLDSLGGGEVSD